MNEAVIYFEHEQSTGVQDVGGVLMENKSLMYITEIQAGDNSAWRYTGKRFKFINGEMQEIDERLVDAGMMAVEDAIRGSIKSSFHIHAGVSNFESYERWLTMKRREALTGMATFQMEKREDDEMFEWYVAHNGVFAAALDNFLAAKRGEEGDNYGL